MPGNKIGQLDTGQGLNRIQQQREGDWQGDEASASYKTGAETQPERSSPDRPTRDSRHSGQNH